MYYTAVAGETPIRPAHLIPAVCSAAPLGSNMNFAPAMSRLRPRRGPAVCPTFLLLLAACTAPPASADYFTILVVDDQTGRGVPLVELRTVDERRYWTDSQGLVAFHEPGLMDREVFFHVRSDGYQFPADGFGYRGKTLRTTPGGRAELRLRRTNVAERLYRVTGAGIYRDSVLLGGEVHLRDPLLNAQVVGSDSVNSIVYHGRVHWFWGDTNRASYPLGNFHVPGADFALAGRRRAGPGARRRPRLLSA